MIGTSLLHKSAWTTERWDISKMHEKAVIGRISN